MSDDPKQPITIGSLVFEPVAGWTGKWRWQSLCIYNIYSTGVPPVKVVGWAAHIDVAGDGGDFGPRLETRLSHHATPAEALRDLVRRLWEYAAWAQEDARKTLVVAGNVLSAARTIEIAIKETP